MAKKRKFNFKCKQCGRAAQTFFYKKKLCQKCTTASYNRTCETCGKQFHERENQSPQCRICRPRASAATKYIRAVSRNWILDPKLFKKEITRLYLYRKAGKLDALDILKIAHIWIQITGDDEKYSNYRTDTQIKGMIETLYMSLKLTHISE